MDNVRSTQRREPDTVNPYRLAARLIASRLKWDLHWKSWLSRGRLRRLQNSHREEKAVIVCNGPSLLQTNLKLLGGVYTFGLNKINLLFDKSEFRPSCIVAVNPLVIEQNRDFYNTTAIPLFIGSVGRGLVRARSDVVFLHPTNIPQFARDCSISIYEGATVTYVALQLAFHFGFSKVAVVGCDHNFATKGPPHATVVSTAADKSHFDPNYFGKGVAWQLPDLPTSEMAYSLAREVYEEFGRKCFNCTVGGNLEIFERLPLDEFLKL
jgi:hypothetical protein